MWVQARKNLINTLIYKLGAVNGINVFKADVIENIFNLIIIAVTYSLLAYGNLIDNKAQHYAKSQYQGINKRGIGV